jgi:phosphate transport system substrate-binding protein
MAQYKCSNKDNCDNADKDEIIPDFSFDPRCPECGAPLILHIPPTPFWKKGLYWSAAIVLTSTLGGLTYLYFHTEPNPPPEQIRTILRFHGTNTIGEKLLPALANAFLQQIEGCKKTTLTAIDKEAKRFVIGQQCQNGQKAQIEIQTKDSAAAFNDLNTGLCDIGMSSRKIKTEEQQALAKLGNLTASTSEQVLAMDGVALIVHPANPVKTLSVTQLADIFSGTVKDWSKLGGTLGAITLYTLDEKSGTHEFFKKAVLDTQHKSLTTIPNQNQFSDSEKLAAAVAANPTGIGFVGLSYSTENSVIAVSDSGVYPRSPSLFSVKTEDYRLSQRLYLYSAEKPTNPYVAKFMAFALGSKAQPIITHANLVNMDIVPALPTPEERKNDFRFKSEKWRTLTAGATELSTHFYFRVDSDALDERAEPDIPRLVAFLKKARHQDKALILIGFADISGNPFYNVGLSQSRAETIKKQFDGSGITVAQTVGLGAEAFIAPNDIPENRAKNRRVEVWIK